MGEKTISFRQGKGSLTHNNRTFIASNVHEERIKDNVTFKAQPIQEAYQHLFADAVERHNAKQKRNDRKFPDYYKHLFKHDYSNNVIQSSNGEKSFYEDIMQIGTMQDTGCGTPDAEAAKDCLIEYMEGFQERNPNFYVFNAVLHMDEATPHLHFDYIPVGHYEGSKLDTRNSISRALEEMGFDKGRNAVARWREREWQVMKQICISHNIEISKPEKSYNYMEVDEYKQYKDTQAQRIAEEQKLSEVQEQLQSEQQLLKEASHLTAQIKSIDEIEAGKTLFGKKSTLPTEQLAALISLAKKQIATQNKTGKAVKENKTLKNELSEIRQKNAMLESELAEYKKPATVSRDALKRESKRISETEQLKSKYKKAVSFIQDMGLSDEYNRYRPNTRKIELE